MDLNFDLHEPPLNPIQESSLEIVVYGAIVCSRFDDHWSFWPCPFDVTRHCEFIWSSTRVQLIRLRLAAYAPVSRKPNSPLLVTLNSSGLFHHHVVWLTGSNHRLHLRAGWTTQLPGRSSCTSLCSFRITATITEALTSFLVQCTSYTTSVELFLYP